MKRMLYIILAVIVIFLLLSIIIGVRLSSPGYQGEESDHFNGKTFLNRSGIQSKGFIDLIAWASSREQGEWNDYSRLPPAGKVRPEAQNRITFVNHSTFLIQTESINILTDPVWSLRVSPFQWAGPKRMATAGIDFNDLPPIDVVVVSHNHYDHLDKQTIINLQTDHKPLFIVPLGVSGFFQELEIDNVVELDWDQSHEHKGTRITSVEAQHFSGRGMTDRDKTLWAGYVIQSDSKTLYFAGDTGFAPFFREIGEKYGPMDVSMIPIGAFKPGWFMSPIHISPAEAVQVHLDVLSKKTIGMHFGTFPLADDSQSDPVNELAEAMILGKIEPEDFIWLANGAHLDY